MLSLHSWLQPASVGNIYTINQTRNEKKYGSGERAIRIMSLCAISLWTTRYCVLGRGNQNMQLVLSHLQPRLSPCRPTFWLGARRSNAAASSQGLHKLAGCCQPAPPGVISCPGAGSQQGGPGVVCCRDAVRKEPNTEAEC